MNIPCTLRQGLFEPLHAIFSRSSKLKYLRTIEHTQYLPEHELRVIQFNRLLELLKFVGVNNDFYRKRFAEAEITSNDIKSLEDLSQLPVLTKSDIRNNKHEMISSGYSVESLQRAKTGGSTGKSLELFFTEVCSELRNACAVRHDCWAGWQPGEPIAACWGNPKHPKTFKEKLKFHLLQPYIYLDTMHVDEAAVYTFLDQWRKVKPTLLYGHAHSIYLLAKSIISMGIDPPKPKGILSTSMMLIPSERKVIEDVFGIKVTDRYGCEEVSLIGSECEKHEGMHLNIEHLVIEFLRDDGTPAAPGEPGRIVVTDLMNKVMPLIRYEVEDVGVPTDRVCSCGRGLPLMENVTGRVADFLIKPDGSKVAGVSLIENTLTAINGMDQMQIVQEELSRFVIRIVPGPGYGPHVKKQLLAYFHSVFGQHINIELEEVGAILPETSGKYRFSICKVIG